MSQIFLTKYFVNIKEKTLAKQRLIAVNYIVETVSKIHLSFVLQKGQQG
jgi:hypothetical protein